VGKERENLKNVVDDLKKVIRYFAAKMEIYPPKNLIQKAWVRRKFFRSPQLGARSPPLLRGDGRLWSTGVAFIHIKRIVECTHIWTLL